MWNNIDYNIFAYACIVLLIIIERMCTYVVKFYIHSFVGSFVHSFHSSMKHVLSADTVQS